MAMHPLHTETYYKTCTHIVIIIYYAVLKMIFQECKQEH